MHPLTVVYGIASLGLAIYGLNSLMMTVFCLVVRPGRVKTRCSLNEWPRVTVQLPVYNEVHVVERVILAAASLDYPADRLQIQVLDDSSDATTAVARRAVARYQARGVNIQLLHRESRDGFKAGALRDALTSASGEYIAIFDADFAPRPDFLKRLLVYFVDTDVGCVQARWGHMNRHHSLLTEAQALAIDGHFGVEQRARAGMGLLLNFNGSAGIWRRNCVVQSGGWQPDTLAEDLDLSYRAQLSGWRIVYDSSVSVDAELPPQFEAVRKQQSRWAQGSIQVAKKLTRLLLRSRQPCFVKLEGLLHLTGYLVHPLLLVALLLGALMVVVEDPVGGWLPHFLLATIMPSLLYVAAQGEDGKIPWRRLRFTPLLILPGMGLAWSNTLAVARALRGCAADFERTPKFGIRGRERVRLGSAYGRWSRPNAIIESVLAIAAATIAVTTARSQGGLLSCWFGLYALGFGSVAVVSLFQWARCLLPEPHRPESRWNALPPWSVSGASRRAEAVSEPSRDPKRSEQR